MYIMPSVAMNGGIPTRATKVPFTMPTRTPATTARAAAAAMGMPCVAMRVYRTAVHATVLPVDRLKFPVIIRRVAALPVMAIMAICLNML
jgi:hypothetical protein